MITESKKLTIEYEYHLDYVGGNKLECKSEAIKVIGGLLFNGDELNAIIKFLEKVNKELNNSNNKNEFGQIFQSVAVTPELVIEDTKPL